MPYAVPLWKSIRDDLRAQVKAGLLKPGDRIPTTRKLMEQH
ncbi:GntR family transcriptional regulator [Solwaraspora sp. WMMA2056]|nr:GntR family transcriptional regulator [Solwaraspora sp. WMMA2056]WJK38150.1 GntR family transcriptional regulator [Solwaraspora sp. WMMA2056]